MDNSALKGLYEKLYAKGADDHYTKSKYKIRQEMYESILDEIDWKGKTVLDVGSGTGEFTYMLSNTGAKEVTGIDYAESAVEEAQKRHNHPSLKYENKNLFDAEGKYDVIVSLGTLEHMDDPLEGLSKMKSLLNENGSILVTVPNFLNPRGYVLLTLLFLFDAKITLADLHHLSPIHFEKWAKELGMNLDWKTICHSWGNTDVCVSDLKDRLPKISESSGPKMSDEKIDELVSWIEQNASPLLEEPNKLSGAIGMFRFDLTP